MRWPNAPQDLIAKIGSDGTLIKNGTASPEGYVINDGQSIFTPPHKPNTPENKRVPAQTYLTIGDLLSKSGALLELVCAGMWTAHSQGTPPYRFAYHHQALSYFKQFAPGTKARKEHLFDLSKFYTQLDQGTIPSVSFIRCTDAYSQHPEDADLYAGLEWCADFIERVQKKPYLEGLRYYRHL